MRAAVAVVGVRRPLAVLAVLIPEHRGVILVTREQLKETPKAPEALKGEIGPRIAPETRKTAGPVAAAADRMAVQRSGVLAGAVSEAGQVVRVLVRVIPTADVVDNGEAIHREAGVLPGLPMVATAAMARIMLSGAVMVGVQRRGVQRI